MGILLSVLSGLVTIFVFPYSFNPDAPYLGWMAWFSIVPLCYVILGASPPKSFFFGFITASIYYTGSLRWMYTAVHDFAGYPPWATCMMICACVVIVAVFVGLACLAAVFITRRFGVSIVLTLPSLWTIADYARTYFPSQGFPWNSLAYSQYVFLPAIQIADVTGTYFVTFLIVLSNVSIAFLVRHRKLRRILFAAPALCLLTFTYGLYRLHTFNTQASENLTVALMHGATPQELKNDRAEGLRQIAVFTDLSGQAVDKGAVLLVWPETIFVGSATIGRRPPLPIETFNTPLIMGAMTTRGDFNLSNSAILIGPDGLIQGVQSKLHLVPFGEYVPKGFSFLRKMVGVKQKIVPGDDYNLFDIRGHKTGTMICYEDVFPGIARRFVKTGAEFLTVISNDGWFEGTSASLQHLTFSVFRAVENRRFLVRSANRGASAIISPTGRIVDHESALTEVSLMGEISPIGAKTLYTRLGDWFIYFMAAGIIALGVQKWRFDSHNQPYHLQVSEKTGTPSRFTV